MPIIEVKNLCKSFGDVVALDGVDIEIERGEAFCLLGPDGAGKTTLLRILAGVMRSDCGEIKMLDQDAAKNADAIKQSIGYLSQRFSLYPDLTVAENIDFYSRLFKISRKDGQQRKERLVRRKEFDWLHR